jgi:hypothetical protein
VDSSRSSRRRSAGSRAAVAQPSSYSVADDDISDLGAVTAGAALLLAPLLCALAFRRVEGWRGAWLPSLAALPAIVFANVLFSAIGDGAATRAGTVVAFAGVAFVGAWLLRESSRAVPSAPRAP